MEIISREITSATQPPNRHTEREERQIKNSFKKCYARYGWDGVYSDLKRKGYSRSFSGMVYAAKRLYREKKCR